ncbi:MAG TPA: hypothetical protein ENI96_14490 [Sedimenticola thiotaurini]|uniref:SAM-dependent chlorinase/fluorinase n=1 Tax=Sedimenticola thiotaurini TaxID=1543721 RepID=A0A831WBU3_9GAMM|nr:hypothetical protein [Sedimenticola thiotaurini]
MVEQSPYPQCIALFTDFGEAGPYLGQMEMVLHQAGIDVPVVRLQSDAPAFEPRAAAYLLAALVRQAALPTLFLGVVDPGVGGDRLPLLLRVDRHWFVGPDNGLFSRVAAQGRELAMAAVEWRPEHLSASFHGRDLFAPVAARVASGQKVETHPLDSIVGLDWPDRLAEVIYIDPYGNACTGLPADTVDRSRSLMVAGKRIGHARTFGEVPAGTAFWYENSLGLLEIAVNRGRADVTLGLTVGSAVGLQG